MLSVATAAVHQNIRRTATTPPSSKANIIVDTSLSWNAELAQSPKPGRSHQGPCSARKKLKIQSPEDDVTLNLKFNNTEITLTPIRKGVSVDTRDDEAEENAVIEKAEDIETESVEQSVYLILESQDAEIDHGDKKCENTLVQFVNSDEISIRPIVRKTIDKKVQIEESILKSELSLTKSNPGERALEITGNVADIMKVHAQFKSLLPSTKNFTLRTTKCEKIESPKENVIENGQIPTKSFYKNTPDQKVIKPFSLSRKFQNPMKKSSPSGLSARLSMAVGNLTYKSENNVNRFPTTVYNTVKPKLPDVLSPTPKVAVVTNPPVLDLQEIPTFRKNFEPSDLASENYNPWHMNNNVETMPNLLDGTKQTDPLDLEEDMLLMSDAELQVPYHMIGFPNPPGENRCWLNATLQALFAMPLLDTFHRYNLQDCSKLTKYLITTKTYWMKGASGREKAYQTVKLLKEELGVLDETYPSERQQDVSEFLMILLNHIKSDLGKLISAEADVDEMENVPKNQQDPHKVLKMPQTPNKRQPLADISTPKNNCVKRSHSLGDPSQSPRVRKQILTHSVQDLLSPKLRKLSNPSDPSYKVHTPPSAPTNDETISNRNPVDENFQLYLMEHYTCKGCQKHRQKKVDNLMLFVDIPSDDGLSVIDLQKAVENIFAPEERSLTCGTCKHDQHTMRTTFRRQPNILTLQVNRYSMSSEGIFAKISTDVKIPKHLDLGATFLNDASNKDLSMYEPICIIAHAGATMDCGHYTSYVRHGDQWYHYNDMNVAPMTEEEALSAAQMTAYLVFFVKSSSAKPDSDQIQKV